MLTYVWYAVAIVRVANTWFQLKELERLGPKMKGIGEHNSRLLV